MINSATLELYQPIILGKLKEKGWNVYLSSDSTDIGSDRVIIRGPASELKTGERYVVLPKVENPCDPIQINGAMENLAMRLNRETPTITVYGERSPWVGFRTYEEGVKISSPEGTTLPYDHFVDSLETIVDLNQ